MTSRAPSSPGANRRHSALTAQHSLALARGERPCTVPGAGDDGSMQPDKGSRPQTAESQLSEWLHAGPQGASAVAWNVECSLFGPRLRESDAKVSRVSRAHRLRKLVFCTVRYNWTRTAGCACCRSLLSTS